MMDLAGQNTNKLKQAVGGDLMYVCPDYACTSPVLACIKGDLGSEIYVPCTSQSVAYPARPQQTDVRIFPA